MLKDTKSLGNNKAPACESRGFVLKKEGVLFDTPSFFVYFCFKVKTIQHRLAVISWSISATEIFPSQKCSRDDEMSTKLMPCKSLIHNRLCRTLW